MREEDWYFIDKKQDVNTRLLSSFNTNTLSNSITSINNSAQQLQLLTVSLRNSSTETNFASKFLLTSYLSWTLGLTNLPHPYSYIIESLHSIICI